MPEVLPAKLNFKGGWAVEFFDCFKSPQAAIDPKHDGGWRLGWGSRSEIVEGGCVL